MSKTLSDKQNKLFVTVIDHFGDIVYEEFDVILLNTYTFGFDLLQENGNLTEFGTEYFPCKYSFNVNGSTVLMRIKN